MIDINKTYRTRDGLEVRIYAMDGRYNYKIHGAVCTRKSGWVPMNWYDDGRVCQSIDDEWDLVEVKPRIQRTYWANIHPNDITYFHTTREIADKMADKHTDGRIACIKVDINCEEGEGL